MDHGQKVHLHFIKTKEEYQPDCNNAHTFVLFQVSTMSQLVQSLLRSILKTLVHGFVFKYLILVLSLNYYNLKIYLRLYSL